MTTYSKCSERESLVALIYDDCEAGERERLEAHLVACGDCAQELDALRSTHVAMAAWPLPPSKDTDGPIVPRLGPDAQPWRLLQSPSVETVEKATAHRVFSTRWIQAAAAVLVIGAGAAVANLEVKYGADGLVVRTGWQRPAEVTTAAQAPAVRPTAASFDLAQGKPWRSDLAELERQLRTEFSARPAADSSARMMTASARSGSTLAATDADALMRRVQRLIDDSQRAQQRELAYRTAQMWRDFETQRRGDLARIEQGFGRLESVTGASALEQREMMNYIMRVSQKQ